MKFREISCDGVDSVQLTRCSQMMKFSDQGTEQFFSHKKLVFSHSFEGFSPVGDIVVHRIILAVQRILNGKIFLAPLIHTGKMERISAACRVLTSVLRVQKPTILP